MRSRRLFLCNLQCFMHNVSFHKCLIIIPLFSVTIVKKRQCTTVVGTPPTALLSANRNIGTKSISVCVDVSVRNRDPFLTFLQSASKKTGFRSSSLCDRVNSTVYLFYWKYLSLWLFRGLTLGQKEFLPNNPLNRTSEECNVVDTGRQPFFIILGNIKYN